MDKNTAPKKGLKRSKTDIVPKKVDKILGKRSMPNSAEDSGCGENNNKPMTLAGSSEKKRAYRKKNTRDYFSDSNQDDLLLKSVSSYQPMPMLLDLGQLNQFLRLIVLNHQDTVKQLSEKPEEKNPKRSFSTYLDHLSLLRKMSEIIWDKPDWYSMETIVQSKVMKGLWMFVSYCEAYFEDCYLVKRCHLNLLLIVEIF